MRNNTGYECSWILIKWIDNPWQPAGHEKNWKPNIGDYYYGLNSAGDIEVKEYFINPLCEWDIKTGNYARTEQEMIDYKRFLIIDRQIRDIADELGRPTEEDWKNDNIPKHAIYWHTKQPKLRVGAFWSDFYQCIIYCLKEEEFLDTCLDHIGQVDMEFWAKYERK